MECTVEGELTVVGVELGPELGDGFEVAAVRSKGPTLPKINVKIRVLI